MQNFIMYINQTLPRLSSLYKKNIREKILKKMASTKNLKKTWKQSPVEANCLEKEIEYTDNFININKFQRKN